MKRVPSKFIGTAVAADFVRNCITCNRWSGCLDPHKKYTYACSRFIESADFTKENLEQLIEQPKQIVDISTVDVKPSDGEATITDIINKILDSAMPVPPDLRINDSGIERPKNVVEWMSDTRFIGEEEAPPFARQLQIGVKMMGEWCPSCTDLDYFDALQVDADLDEMYDRILYLEHGICPQCKATKAELVAEEILDDPTEMCGIAGQRSSKTITVTQLEGYNLSRLLMTPKVHSIFGVKASTVFTSTYTALTFNQAKENFWNPYNNLLRESAWFKQYHAMLRSEGARLGEDLYAHGEIAINYRHKNYIASPAAPYMRALRGRTRWSAAIDEMDWYPAGKTAAGKEYERLNANEVHTALRNSLSTLSKAYIRRLKQNYFNLPKPIFCNISSPASINGPLMVLYRKSIGSRSVYAFKYPTWEVNPLLPRESFSEEFKLKPIDTERDYGCNPPLASNAFFTAKEHTIVTKLFSGKRNGIELKSIRGKTKNGKDITSGFLKMRVPNTSNYKGILAIDCGYNNNSFSVCIAYPDTIPDREDVGDHEGDLSVPVTVYAVGEIVPKVDRPISFTKMYNDVLLPICNTYGIGLLVADRWQSIKMLQDIEDSTQTATMMYSLKYNDFVAFKEACYDGLITLPKCELTYEEIMDIDIDTYPDCFLNTPAAHLLYQFLTVQDNKASIIKGEATDDTFRCVVLAYTILNNPDYAEYWMEYEDTSPNSMGIGAVGSSGSVARSSVTDIGVASVKTTVSGSGSSSIGVRSTSRR